MCPWGGLLLNHDQTFRWSSSFYNGGNIVSITSRFLCFKFHDAFTTHFSSHQFKVTMKGGCETVIHGIRCTLDLHLNWVVLQLDVVNAFNLMSRGVILQKLVQHVVTSYKSSLLYVHSMHLNLCCFTVIIIVKAMLESSHMPYGLIKVIPWEGHYSF
jgi:hypothetical protein